MMADLSDDCCALCFSWLLILCSSLFIFVLAVLAYNISLAPNVAASRLLIMLFRNAMSFSRVYLPVVKCEDSFFSIFSRVNRGQNNIVSSRWEWNFEMLAGLFFLFTPW